MGNKIKFSGLQKQYKSIKKEIDSAIKKVLAQGEFVGGIVVEDFEKKMAEFCGTKYAVSVNSGTDALFLSLKALGIGPGDEVITTPFTFIATAEVIANLGAKPVFVDIDPKTFNIDSLKIEKAITAKTKAIIPVHLFGQMADMDEIMKIAELHNLFVVEDAAQSAGAEYSGKKAGSIGDLGCLSFFPSKNLGAYGDGGMVLTNNGILADKIRLLKSHGSDPENKYLNVALGVNSRLDSIQAAILNAKLKSLNKWNKKRSVLAGNYSKKIKTLSGIVPPFVSIKRNHIFYAYVVLAQKRNELKKYLEETGIPTLIYYPLPLHLQPVLSYLGYKKGDFPAAEKAAKEVLSLPIYPELSASEQHSIIQKIKDFYAD